MSFIGLREKNNFESKLIVTQKRIIKLEKTYFWGGEPAAGAPTQYHEKFLLKICQ